MLKMGSRAEEDMKILRGKINMKHAIFDWSHCFIMNVLLETERQHQWKKIASGKCQQQNAY